MRYLSFLFLLAFQAQAVEFNFAKDVKAQEKVVIQKALQEVMGMVPSSFEKGLPRSINIKLKSFDGAQSIPDVCEGEEIKFRYGEYRFVDKSLTLNRAILSELEKGPNVSKRISCQHGSLYKQAIATILHELTHAYDRNSGRPSKDENFRNLMGFKKFLVFTKSKNKEPMRSMDEYEFKNPEEAFAVNMEYFTMDPEYACRRPVIFSHYKNLFGVDPHPNRSCKVNYTVMAATQIGLVPYNIDPSRVYRIDYLLASNGSDLSSGFGHSMFRIVLCASEHTNSLTGNLVPATPNSKKCLDDKLFHIVGSFRANNQGTTLNYMKGIFGGYPSMLFMLPFSDVLEQYNRSEMRDLISYPLKLTQKEKKEFLERLIEQHWDYRGDYKFITNNCAVESLNTIKNIMNEREKVTKSDLTPNITPKAVLNVFIQRGLVDPNDSDIQTFSASTGNLMTAYSVAYLDKKTVDQKTFTNFILKSKPEDRLQKFNQSFKQVVSAASEGERLSNLKAQLVKLASFSVVEQQIVRSKTDLMKKKLADYTSQKKNIEKHPELYAAFNASKEKTIDMTKASGNGYGIPQEEELKITIDEVSATSEARELFELGQKIIVDLFPGEVKELEDLAVNLKFMNDKALVKRREYRKEFEIYVSNSLDKLASTAQGQSLLKEARQGNTQNLREKLGKDVLTMSEISDEKIFRLIDDLI